MEKIITLQNRHWTKIYEGLIPRVCLTKIISKIKLKEIQVLLGVRRSGKSTLFKLIINHLIENGVDPKKILYLNFEDPFFSNVWKEPKLIYSTIEVAEKLIGERIEYLFLDEIQAVENWQSFIKSVYDSEVFRKIFITVSNSGLLKSDYSKMLSGRFVYDFVYPLSFREICFHQNINNYLDLLNNMPKVLNLTETVIQYGTFPEVYKTSDEDLKREQLIAYYNTILLKDCIENGQAKDVNLLEHLSYYLLTNSTNPFSYNSIGKALKSNENTVKKYIEILKNAFLVFEINKFSYKFKEQIKSPKKIYIIDNGLVNTLSFKFSENKGSLFENFIFTELMKLGIREIYYYITDNRKYECDFLIKKEEKFLPLQVTYNLNEQNIEREINSLRAVMNELNIKEGYILTFNQELESDDIKVIPFYKFFYELF